MKQTVKLWALSSVVAVGVMTTRAESHEIDGLRYTPAADGVTVSVAPVSKDITRADIPASVTIDGREHAVTAIDAWAFYSCRQLESISLPPTLRHFGAYAFASCDALRRVEISDLGAWCASTFDNGYANPLMCGHDLYVGGEQVVALVLPAGLTGVRECSFAGLSATSVSMPSDLGAIGQLAFYQSGIESLEVPGSVTEVGVSAFAGCGALAHVTLDEGVKSIGDYAFDGCTALSTLSLPASLSAIGTDAFNDCDALACIDLADIDAWCAIDFSNRGSNPLCRAHVLTVGGNPVERLVVGGTITEIAPSLFEGCTTLKSLSITAPVTTIGASAFAGCTSLQSAAMGSALTTLGESAFEGDEALMTLSLPATLATAGNYAFYGCKKLTAISLPDGLTAISDGLLGECSSLESIKLPASATSIGFGTFYGCTALTAIDVPDPVKLVGKSAFNGCTSLVTITLGSGLEQLSAFAFGNCPALASLTVKALTPPEAAASTFDDYTATLHVPATALGAYAAHDVWGRFADRRAIGSGMNDVSATEPTVEAAVGSISVEGAAAVVIHDVAGHCVYSGPAALIPLAPGHYIVTADGTPRRVSVP